MDRDSGHPNLTSQAPNAAQNLGPNVRERVRKSPRALMVFIVITTVWGANIAFRTVDGAPRPVIHDEFSYLLAAETFASGRLTNPSPPLPAFFETFHILDGPTRASKYPPGQGLVLALGQRIGGHPFFGVWLGGWFFCLAAAWMLAAFAPPRWALAGAVLAALHPQTVEWGLRYWGGLVAATGATVVLGAIGRMRRDVRPRWALGYAAGASILALTRPFEGAVFCTAAALLLLIPRTQPWRVLVLKGLIPALLGLVPVAAFTLIYNDAVTGHALVMPYEVYQRAHIQTPTFLWQDIDTRVHHRHAVMAEFEQKWITRYEKQHTLLGFLDTKADVLVRLLDGFTARGALLVPAALWAWLSFRNKRRRGRVASTRRGPTDTRSHGRHTALGIGAALGIACFVTLMPETYAHKHYVPWGLPAAVLVAVSSSRIMGAFSRRRQVSRLAFAAVVALAFVLSLWTRPQRVKKELKARFTTEAQLIEQPGDHIVFVRYGNGHSPYHEWVYNPADLDTARVLFVRDLGAENETLLRTMPSRTPWLATVSPAGHSVTRLSISP